MGLAMITDPFSSAGMFQLAAVTNFSSIFGHLIYGIKHYYDKFEHIPDEPQYRLAKYGSIGTWHYVSLAFFIEACMDWRWASTDGPSTWEEELIFWSVLIIGLVGGWRNFTMSYWQPLIPFWYANAFASLGYAMAKRM